MLSSTASVVSNSSGICYDVPTIAQEKRMCCWHTSAMMIWRYWQRTTGRQGPMNTLEQVYSDNNGLVPSPRELIRLAQTVGLHPVLPIKNDYTADDLIGLLRQHGPLWCGGFWYGFGHVVVLTGVRQGGLIALNDPDQGVRKAGTVAWFNRKLMKAPGAIMCKDPAAY